MKYDLKEHGLIGEDGKVTLVGRIILESALQTKAFLEENDYEPKEEVSAPTCCMNLSEIKAWEIDHNALWLQDEFGGFIELMPILLHSETEYQEALGCTIVDESASRQIRLIYTDKKELTRLRDYLAKYIEQK